MLEPEPDPESAVSSYARPRRSVVLPRGTPNYAVLAGRAFRARRGPASNGRQLSSAPSRYPGGGGAIQHDNLTVNDATALGSIHEREEVQEHAARERVDGNSVQYFPQMSGAAGQGYGVSIGNVSRINPALGDHERRVEASSANDEVLRRFLAPTPEEQAEDARVSAQVLATLSASHEPQTLMGSGTDGLTATATNIPTTFDLQALAHGYMPPGTLTPPLQPFDASDGSDPYGGQWHPSMMWNDGAMLPGSMFSMLFTAGGTSFDASTWHQSPLDNAALDSAVMRGSSAGFSGDDRISTGTGGASPASDASQAPTDQEQSLERGSPATLHELLVAAGGESSVNSIENMAGTSPDELPAQDVGVAARESFNSTQSTAFVSDHNAPTTQHADRMDISDEAAAAPETEDIAAGVDATRPATLRSFWNPAYIQPAIGSMLATAHLTAAPAVPPAVQDRPEQGAIDGVLLFVVELSDTSHDSHKILPEFLKATTSTDAWGAAKCVALRRMFKKVMARVADGDKIALDLQDTLLEFPDATVGTSTTFASPLPSREDLALDRDFVVAPGQLSDWMGSSSDINLQLDLRACQPSEATYRMVDELCNKSFSDGAAMAARVTNLYVVYISLPARAHGYGAHFARGSPAPPAQSGAVAAAPGPHVSDADAKIAYLDLFQAGPRAKLLLLKTNQDYKDAKAFAAMFRVRTANTVASDLGLNVNRSDARAPCVWGSRILVFKNSDLATWLGSIVAPGTPVEQMQLSVGTLRNDRTLIGKVRSAIASLQAKTYRGPEEDKLMVELNVLNDGVPREGALTPRELLGGSYKWSSRELSIILLNLIPSSR